MATATTQGQTMADVIAAAKASIVAALAERMKAAALAAVQSMDFSKLAADAADRVDISDEAALLEAGQEEIEGADWGWTLE